MTMKINECRATINMKSLGNDERGEQAYNTQNMDARHLCKLGIWYVACEQARLVN